MIYILIRKADKKVMGGSDKRYHLSTWASRQPEESWDGYVIERHNGMSGDVVRFPLRDLMNNPNLKIRS